MVSTVLSEPGVDRAAHGPDIDQQSNPVRDFRRFGEITQQRHAAIHPGGGGDPAGGVEREHHDFQLTGLVKAANGIDRRLDGRQHYSKPSQRQRHARQDDLIARPAMERSWRMSLL